MLELDGLSRRFGDVIALDGLSFTVPTGQVFGFLGPNGAGKTTAMRAVFELVGLDSGVVRWQGVPVTSTDRRRFGYMPEERGLYPGMVVVEQIQYLARLHGVGADDARGRPCTGSNGSVSLIGPPPSSRPCHWGTNSASSWPPPSSTSPSSSCSTSPCRASTRSGSTPSAPCSWRRRPAGAGVVLEPPDRPRRGPVPVGRHRRPRSPGGPGHGARAHHAAVDADSWSRWRATSRRRGPPVSPA